VLLSFKPTFRKEISYEELLLHNEKNFQKENSKKEISDLISNIHKTL